MVLGLKWGSTGRSYGDQISLSIKDIWKQNVREEKLLWQYTIGLISTDSRGIIMMVVRGELPKKDSHLRLGCTWINTNVTE